MMMQIGNCQLEYNNSGLERFISNAYAYGGGLLFGSGVAYSIVAIITMDETKSADEKINFIVGGCLFSLIVALGVGSTIDHHLRGRMMSLTCRTHAVNVHTLNDEIPEKSHDCIFKTNPLLTTSDKINAEVLGLLAGFYTMSGVIVGTLVTDLAIGIIFAIDNAGRRTRSDGEIKTILSTVTLAGFTVSILAAVVSRAVIKWSVGKMWADKALAKLK